MDSGIGELMVQALMAERQRAALEYRRSHLAARPVRSWLAHALARLSLAVDRPAATSTLRRTLASR